MNKLCSSCQKPLNQQESFCLHCGGNNPHFLKSSRSSMDQSQSSYTNSPSSSNQSKSDSSSAIWWGIASAIIPFLGFILFIAFIEKKPVSAIASLIGFFFSVIFLNL